LCSIRRGGRQFSPIRPGGIKAQIPLYTAFTIDELSLPAAEGQRGSASLAAQEWVNDLPNAENKLVQDYRKKYPGLRPNLLRRASL